MVDSALPRTRDRIGDPRYASRLSAAFAVLLLLTLSLIVLGALVRAHGAGLSCPDWPLCFGAFVPEFDLKVAFEYTHRVFAGGISLAFASLAALVLRRGGTRRAAGALVAVAAGLLGVQILLGALTVWKLLASWTVTSHLLVGNGFAVSLLWIALALRDAAHPATPAPAIPRAPRAWVSAAAVLLFAQMVLGGLVSSRYAGMACPEWPTCNGGLWFPSWMGSVGLHLMHRMNAYALLLVLSGAVVACRRTALLLPTALACGIALAQVQVGILNVMLGIPVELTGLHSALAAALVLTTSVAVRGAWLRPGPRC